MTSAGVVLLDVDGTLARRRGRWSHCHVAALDAVDPGHGLTPDELGTPDVIVLDRRPVGDSLRWERTSG